MDQLVHNCWNIYSEVCADGSIMTCSVVRAAARLFVIYITFATEWIFADDSSLQRVCWNHSKVTMMQLCVTDTSPCPVCVFIRRPKKKKKKTTADDLRYSFGAIYELYKCTDAAPTYRQGCDQFLQLGLF